MNIKIAMLEDEGSLIPAIIITDEKIGELRYELQRGIVDKEEADLVLKITKLAVEAVGLDLAQKWREEIDKSKP